MNQNFTVPQYPIHPFQETTGSDDKAAYKSKDSGQFWPQYYKNQQAHGAYHREPPFFLVIKNNQNK